MVYYIYKTKVKEISKSSPDNESEFTYRIIIPTPPTENPTRDMLIAVNNFLEENNTNTQVASIKDFEYIKSVTSETIDEDYDYKLSKEGEGSIVDKIKSII